MNSIHLPLGMLVDLDDTIIDDTGSMQQCWVEVCNQAAAGLDGITGDRLFAAIDARRDWFWSDPDRHREGRLQLRETTVRIVTIALGDLGIESPDLARQIGETYRDRRDDRLSLFPGALDTLAALREAGVRLAMLTNGAATPQRAKIERFALARYFDCIIVEGEFGVGKPEARVYTTYTPSTPSASRLTKLGASATASNATSRPPWRPASTASGTTRNAPASLRTPR